MRVERLSVNQVTAGSATTLDLLDACAENEIRLVGLWRDRYIADSAAATAAAVRARGLSVSSLCRGGFFTGQPAGSRVSDDNLHALDEAAALGAGCLVLVCGPLDASGAAAAWDRIVDGLAQLAPMAQTAGVTLAVEPFHPMLAAERSAIVTLDQAADLLEAVGYDTVRIAIDSYHVWWDPRLTQALSRTAADIAVVQLGDWLVPTTSLTAGRGLPGDGVIELGSFVRRLNAAGYDGPVEVEVLNPDVWQIPVRELLPLIHRRLEGLFVPDLAPADAATGAVGVRRSSPDDGAGGGSDVPPTPPPEPDGGNELSRSVLPN
jgi:sugar phosphate isomerase/epimerase